jgi:outer membrane protein
MRRKPVKKSLLILASIFLISLSAQASAGKTGYMDIQTIFNKTILGKKYQGILRGYYESRKKILDRDADEIQKLREDYDKQKQAKLMSESAQKEQEETLSRKINEFEKIRAEFTDEINKKDEELLNEFNRQVLAVLKEIAKREKISLILNKTISVSKAEIPSVMYADEDLDMTDKIITEMDKKEEVVN